LVNVLTFLSSGNLLVFFVSLADIHNEKTTTDHKSGAEKEPQPETR